MSPRSLPSIAVAVAAAVVLCAGGIGATLTRSSGAGPPCAVPASPTSPTATPAAPPPSSTPPRPRRPDSARPDRALKSAHPAPDPGSGSAVPVSASDGTLGECSTAGPLGWVAPVRGPVVSGFRTAERPGHDGVDLGAVRGTPVHAAASGVVRVVRCNITPASHGCDRDGHATLVRGCGWYTDIEHPGGLVTRYCHLLTRPNLAEGQPVLAGQVIGVVGSSGRSSGPHLHYEVHVRREALNKGKEVYEPVDPVPFLAQRGVKLGAA